MHRIVHPPNRVLPLRTTVFFVAKLWGFCTAPFRFDLQSQRFANKSVCKTPEVMPNRTPTTWQNPPACKQQHPTKRRASDPQKHGRRKPPLIQRRSNCQRACGTTSTTRILRHRRQEISHDYWPPPIVGTTILTRLGRRIRCSFRISVSAAGAFHTERNESSLNVATVVRLCYNIGRFIWEIPK